MDNLQDLLDNIKAAAQEGQSAAIDAINAIKQARIAKQMAGGQKGTLPGGTETTVEVEPGLTQPKDTPQLDTSNTIIDDPDNLLQKTSQNGPKNGNPKSDQNPNEPEEPKKSDGPKEPGDEPAKDGPEGPVDEPGDEPVKNGPENPKKPDDGKGPQGPGTNGGDFPTNKTPEGPEGPQGPGSNGPQGPQGPQGPTTNGGPQDSNGPQDGKDTNKTPAKKAPDLEKPKDEHQAPDKQSLAGRKITIGRVLNLAKGALSKVSGFMTEAVTPTQSSIDRVKKDIEDLQKLTDEEITEMSADRFNDLISKVLDNIDKVSQVDYSNDLDTRIQKINQEMSDPELAKELGREDSMNKQRAAKEAEASEREKNKYTSGHFKSISQFNIKFYRAIKDQVDEIEDDVDTWSAINKHHSDDGIIAKGTHLEDVPNDAIPSVDVYVDCSGSWSDSDIARGEQALHQILEFERRGEITTHIYYGTDGLHPTKEAAFAVGRCTYFWDEMIENIKAKRTKNVVVLTDSDMNGLAYNSGTRTIVDGVVYWIWRNGDRGEYLVKNLRGRRDNDEFEFTSSDD